MTSPDFTKHIPNDCPGNFHLTEAIRPAHQAPITPREGYRIQLYQDLRAGLRVPVLAASVSRERLFDTFLQLLEPLGDTVNVVLETSHEHRGCSHSDLYREHIDRPVLESYLCEFEDLLVNDGCTGVAVIGAEAPVEVQFDEHKLLIVYAHDLTRFEQILARAGIPRDDQLRLITEGDHVHATNRGHREAFEQLAYRLGVGETAEHINW